MNDHDERIRSRARIMEKIRALLAKTLANGATEAEAIAAAAKAAELMERYDLTMDDLDVSMSSTRTAERGLDPVLRASTIRVAMSVARLCETKFWVDHGGANARKGFFIGLPHDVEISGYLLDICEYALRRESERFRNDIAILRPSFRDSRMASFLDGMATRLCERLDEMAARRRSGGRGLVPLKAELIERALKEEGLKLRPTRVGRRDHHKRDYELGGSLGDRVSLNPAVRNGTDVDGMIDG